MTQAQEQRRKQAIARYLAGENIDVICRDLHCAQSWLYTWKARYQADALEWAKSVSTPPQHKPSQLPQRMQQRVGALRRTSTPSGKPASAEAIQQELKHQGIKPIPAQRTIYRMLQRHDQEDISLNRGLASIPDFVVLLNGPRGHIMKPISS
jgi:transposase